MAITKSQMQKAFQDKLKREREKKIREKRRKEMEKRMKEQARKAAEAAEAAGRQSMKQLERRRNVSRDKLKIR
tara:strand:- start:148 stop:366 length:219 start_codon:yes stop_codon:yes gene_type:complete